MSPDVRRIPEYLLERLTAGDLPSRDRAALLEALAREPGGRERLAALLCGDAEMLARIPPKAFAARVAEREGARSAPRAWLLLPVAAAAALALVILAPDRGTRGPAEPEDVTRVKGLEPHLVIHRDGRGGDERLAPGASAKPGDLLQLGYVAGRKRFGVIVSIDGRGLATRHWPDAGGSAGALASTREALLPHSFQLDDAPGFERFLLVTSDSPFTVEEVLRAARALASRPDASSAPLPIDHGLTVSSTLILKEVR